MTHSPPTHQAIIRQLESAAAHVPDLLILPESLAPNLVKAVTSPPANETPGRSKGPSRR